MQRNSKNALRLLTESGSGRVSSSGLESTGGDAANELSKTRADQLIESAEQAIRNAAPSADMDPAAFSAAQQRLADDVQEAVTRLHRDGAAATLSRRHAGGLEAVVHADGSRPVLFVQNGEVDPDANDEVLGAWRPDLQQHRDAVAAVAQAVGRVDLGPGNRHMGTAFALADGLVATNRHVLEEIADENRFAGPGEERFDLKDDVFVDFLGEKDNPATDRFKVEEIVFAGPRRINRVIDFGNLDVAVLRVAAVDGGTFPTAPRFDPIGAQSIGTDAPTLEAEGKIFVMGFPARPPDPSSDTDFQTVFASEFGSKRWAPGRIEALPGEIAKDQKAWILSHDASTLAGNSGSVIMDFSRPDARAIGIHFGGFRRDMNFAHALAELQNHLTTFGADYS